jgi:hypothetical protein
MLKPIILAGHATVTPQPPCPVAWVLQYGRCIRSMLLFSQMAIALKRNVQGFVFTRKILAVFIHRTRFESDDMHFSKRFISMYCCNNKFRVIVFVHLRLIKNLGDVLFLCFGSGNLILTELISVHVSKILPVRVISITITTIIIIHGRYKFNYTLLCARKCG